MMDIGYKLYEGTENFDKIQLEMAVFCDENGYCLEDGYEDDKYYLIIKPPCPPTIEEAKQQKWEEIKAYRDAEEQSGCPYMGSVLDSDSLSVQRINTAVQAAQVVGESFEVSWTMKDNTVIHMAYADVLGMPAALAVFSNQLHMKAREKRDQINAAQTIEEVEAIAWK